MKKTIIFLTAACTCAGFGANCCAGGACEFVPPNTLSAAEKAAGWQLLWDGKSFDGWVGERNGCKAPPEKGWNREDGVVTVLPRKGIRDGRWVDRPKEQAALGGGGDLVTAKDYRDFELSVDFRLTKAAHSGIQQAEKFNILKLAGERKDELAALAAKYDLKAALNKKPGDFTALIRETKELLNR